MEHRFELEEVTVERTVIPPKHDMHDMDVVLRAFGEETVAANVWEVIDLLPDSGLSDIDIGIAVADLVKWGYLTYGLNGIHRTR